MGKWWKQSQAFFSSTPKSLQVVTAAMKLRHLLHGGKAMINLDSMLKRRDITLWSKVHLVKAVVCPLVMYGSESLTIKKGEHWKTDAFELWCWRRLLRGPWTARRSNQSILNEISPGYSWKDLCQSWISNLWPPDAKNWLFGKDPDAVKGWRQEKKVLTEDETVGWHHWLDGHDFEQSPGLGDGQGSLACRSPWGCKESDTTERLNWTKHPHSHWPAVGLCSCVFLTLLFPKSRRSSQVLSKSLQSPSRKLKHFPLLSPPSVPNALCKVHFWKSRQECPLLCKLFYAKWLSTDLSGPAQRTDKAQS